MQWIPCSVAQWIPIECSGFHAVWLNGSRLNAVDSMQRLSARERVIIDMRFGLTNNDGKEKTQKEVAEILGISQSYISRLEKKIMKRLRSEILKIG